MAGAIHLSMAAVNKDNAIGSTAPGTEVLQQVEETAITPTPQPARAISRCRGCDRVSHTHQQRHPFRGDALLHQRQQRFGIVGSRSHIERLTQGRFTPTALDVLIEQHQKAGLLDGPGEHELNVGGSHITCSSGLDPFLTLRITAQVGSHMQEKRFLQALACRLSKQLMHQLREHRLQGLLSADISGDKFKNPVEIDGG